MGLLVSKAMFTTGAVRRAARTATAVIVLGAVVALAGASPAAAAEAPVGLGAADSYAVLAGSTVTNTGPTQVSGDLGVSPGSAVTGFPPGEVENGTIHAADAHAANAQADLVTAYNDAAGRTTTDTVAADLGGQTLVPGVYEGGSLSITGTLTLDGGGDPDAVFIFKAASTLVTASSSDIAFIGDADPCNVYWQVTSSATLGTNSDFSGTILALTSITANTGASVEGRLLARNGAVTLDSNDVTITPCAAAAPEDTTTTSTTSTTAVPGTTSTSTPAASTTSTTGDVAGPTTTVGGTGLVTTTTVAGGSSTDLPRTGEGPTALALAGIVALGLGGGLVLSTRRTRRAA